MSEKRIETTLGRPIVPDGDEYVLDLVELPVFRGLSVLSRALGEMFESQAYDAHVDVSIERAIRSTENPELIREFALRRIRLSVERDLAQRLTQDRECLQDCLRTILGTLQRPRYRDAIFPSDAEPSHALVFRLTVADAETRFVLERIHGRQDGECALRLTIEDPHGRRLDLTSLPHVDVEELDRRVFVAGSTRIAQTLAEGMRREAERGRRRYSERRRPWQHLFEQLDKAGLDGFEEVLVTWSDEEQPFILESEPNVLETVTKQVLLALEDLDVRQILRRGDVLRVETSETKTWIETSQLGRVLHLSIGSRRTRPDIDAFLERMPALSAVVRSACDGADALPLQNTSVFLVHHITSEVLGTIAALRELGCRDLHVVFVSYASEPAADWLAALLDLPEDEFRCHALMHLPAKTSVEGRYALSPRYSRNDGLESIAHALATPGLDYLQAMRRLTVPSFVEFCDAARARGHRVLLVEDGGYVAPVLQDAILRNECIGDVFRTCGLDPRDQTGDSTKLLANLVDIASQNDDAFVGSVEHTRNGYERLVRVGERHGGYAFPSFSIAISEHKFEVESEEVAASVVHAVETVLESGGKILNRRFPAVIGHRGAIGSRTFRILSQRLPTVLGVDLVVEHETERETCTWRALPVEARRLVDLVIGITGDSVLDGDDIEDWLLHGEPRELLLASGSTKTVEFSGLAQWLDRLRSQDTPRIGSHRVHVRHEEVVDAQTERVYGDRWRFSVELPSGEVRERSLVFAAHMTPINFMFYGVATEMIDEILAELVSTSIGLVRRAGTIPPGLYAVDREIDAWGRPLA
ncbi:MAG: hypothetical protein KDC95_05630 [Planctomycetes bacterium]|nr:hypothetical protein [Planctomycetota bacterium]